jgi:signal transduction histidine kinase
VPWRWGLAGLLAALLAGGALVRWDIADRRSAFQADARTAHRLLSQRAAQHDAMLATLVLLDRGATASEHPETRLPALYPQVLQVLRRGPGEPWDDPDLVLAEEASRQAGRAVLAALDAGRGQSTLLLAGTPASYALRIDTRRWVPWGEAPFDPAGPMRLALEHAGQAIVLQPGTTGATWAPTAGFVFDKVLGTPSQPFALQARLATGPADWPWARLALLLSVLAGGLALAASWQQQRERRRRAEELLRLARTARLNSLGELAAGMAHELNQPLTAVLANTQAARRLLDEDPLPLATLHEALDQARAQARRAADVVARLRGLVERPQAAPTRPVDLAATLQQVLALLAPDLQRLAVRVQVDGGPLTVLADPVALEQIVHNLLVNALQALATVDPARRGLTLTLAEVGGQGVLTVRDSGPGLAPEVLARLFVPFTSTRPDGLGLGLSLCETLAGAMGGSLAAQNVAPHGAEFRLVLPLT